MEQMSILITSYSLFLISHFLFGHISYIISVTVSVQQTKVDYNERRGDRLFHANNLDFVISLRERNGI